MKKLLLILAFLLLFTGCESTSNVDPNKKDKGTVRLKAVEYSDTALTYITTVKNLVRTGGIAIFGDDSIYMVPVGDENTFACSGVSGVTPYGYAHKYAYVGVIKTGKVYTYYFLSKDEGGNGFNLHTEKVIKAGKGQEVVSGKNLKEYKVLEQLYKQKGETRDTYYEITLDNFDDEEGSFKQALGNNTRITKVKIYYYNVCKG